MKIDLSRVVYLFLVVLMCIPALTACGAPSGSLKAAARAAFERWTQDAETPYSDVRYRTVSDDGTFATIRIMAFFRPEAEAGWREMQADLECRKVTGEWQCDPSLNFTLSAAEQERLAKTLSATATVVAATRIAAAEATQTAQVAANATATAEWGARKRATETAVVAATATVQSARATQTAVAIDQQLAPLYQQALSAYKSEDWWLAGYYLRQIAQVQASYRDTDMLLQKIETEHPQGHILVTESRGNIYLMDAWGTEMQQIETGSVATFSPDGESIAFIRGNYLRIGPLHGEHPVVLDLQLTADAPPFVSWSPDGKSLLIPVDRPVRLAPSGERGIGLFNIESGHVQEIVRANSKEFGGDIWLIILGATWTPEGNRIGFVQGWLSIPTMWVLDLASGTSMEIGMTPGRSFGWSPDGDLIAYRGRRGLYTMHADGSNAKPVINADGLPIDEIEYTLEVTWSPDGSKVLCVVCAGTWRYELWVVDPDRSYAVEIATFRGIDVPPSWSR